MVYVVLCVMYRMSRDEEEEEEEGEGSPPHIDDEERRHLFHTREQLGVCMCVCVCTTNHCVHVCQCTM